MPSKNLLSANTRSRARRIAGLVYGASAFIGTWVFFVWFAIFLGNLPKRASPWIEPTVDRGTEIDPVVAAIANFALVTLFCLQHSVMARPSVKRAMATCIPADLERATYVHAANLAGFALLALWTPISIPVWSIGNDILKAAIWFGFGLGWLTLLLAALSMGITELLGLRQTWHWYTGKPAPRLALKTSWLYRYCEHPMYVGVLLGVWMTPHMTVGHALLALQFTLYIALAMRFERRDLEQRYGKDYLHWRSPDRPRTLPAAAISGIARGLERSFAPVAAEPLPRRMTVLLARI